MFNEEYDDIRKAIGNAQEQTLQLAVSLNGVNPSQGGPGLTPEQTHQAIGSLTAEVHNLAFAFGNLVDILDQNSRTTQPPS